MAVKNYLDSLSFETSASQEPENLLQSSGKFFPNPEKRTVTVRDNAEFYQSLLDEYQENQLGSQLLILALLNTENLRTRDLKTYIAKACFPQLFATEGLGKLLETLQQSITEPNEALMSRLGQATQTLSVDAVTAIMSELEQRPSLSS